MVVALSEGFSEKVSEMNTPTMAAGCLEHLESLKKFFVTPPRRSRFASFYRKLLVHRYNLLISPDANVIEIGCGMGELLNGLHAMLKLASIYRPNRSRVAKSDSHISICVPGPERLV
jgi:hypothetical protein